jgi:hypothetical protein
MVDVEYDALLSPGQDTEPPSRAWPVARRRYLGLSNIAKVAALCLTLWTCSCEGEDPPQPPDALLGFLQPSEIQVLSSGPGLAYYGLRNLEKPWAVHILRVDLNRCDLGVGVLEAPVPGGEGNGRTTVSELVAAEGVETPAAVNGDFFTPEGLPVGTEVVRGATRRVRNRPAFAWRPGDDPWMGIPALEEESVLKLGWELSRSQGDRGTEVIGGFPLLLSQGVRVGDLEVSDRPSFAAERHPRTAVGFDSDLDLLWVVVVDGRQPGLSVGMTLPELTALFEVLGVEDALNLDGGGSSVMVFEGKAVSSPSDAEGERPVVNALGVRRAKGFCGPGL